MPEKYVLLVDSERPTEKLVTKAIPLVIPEVDENRALNCYNTSKALGVALIVTAIKERAEAYSQQLFRYRVRSKVEPDGDSL